MNKLIILFFLLFSFVCNSQISQEYFIQIDDESMATNLKNDSKVKTINNPFILEKLHNIYLVKFHNEIDIENVLLIVSQYFKPKLIEAVPQYQLFWTPNDYDNSQYNLDLIQAEQALDIHNDASDIVIAVIDDAIALQHPDLAANILYNSGEIPNNGLDDDGNGFIDDNVGWDFADGDNDPSPYTSTTMNLDHGSHVSGICSGVTSNNTGIASIGSNAKILPIKIGADNNGALSNTAQAIDYAIANGADVINMSWGGGMFSGVMEMLFEAANEEGIICVAASGNSNSSAAMYPASYNYVISVSSTDDQDQKSWFSNYGPTVDVSAPGSDIYSVLTGGIVDYDFKSGTSMASPLVAGLVALIRSANPIATPQEIEDCLLSTCDPINGALANEMGAGRVNAFEALTCITAVNPAFNSGFTQICNGNSIQFFNYSFGSNLTYSWSFPGGNPTTSSLQNPIINYPNDGVYNVSLTINDGTNVYTNLETNFITVNPPEAIVSGLSQVYPGGYGSVIINFTGNPPYQFDITDGNNTYNYTNIWDSPFLDFYPVDTTSTFIIDNFIDNQCDGIETGFAEIEVLNLEGSNCDPLTSTFIKYLGTDVDDFGQSVHHLTGVGYLVLGRKILGPVNLRSYIALVDECGIVLWENIYTPFLYGIPIAAFLDGNEIVVGGYTENSPKRTFYMRLDLEGNPLDFRWFGGAVWSVYPRQMERFSDNTIVYGGSSNSESFGTNDFYLVKTSIEGVVIWSNHYGGPQEDFLNNIHEDSEGNIICSGYFREYSGSLWSGAVFKTDANGSVLWAKKYDTGGTGHTLFGKTVELNNHYYTIGYNSENGIGGVDAILIKIDFDGNLVWSKVIGGVGADQGGGITKYNENILCSLKVQDGVNDTDVVLAVISQEGEIIESVSFGTTNDDIVNRSSSTLNYSLEQGIYGIAHGNGNLLGGDDILFFKTPSLNSFCEDSGLDIEILDLNLIEADFVYNEGTLNLQFSEPPIPIEPVISNQGFLCSNIVNDSIPDCDPEIDIVVENEPCFENIFEFIQTDNGTITPDFWQWDFGDGTLIQELNNNTIDYTYLTEGNYTVELICGQLDIGCLDTITTQISITTPNHICEIGIDNSSLFCLNSDVIFENLSFTNEPNPIYNWSFGQNSSPNSYTGEIPPTITYTSSGTKEVILEMVLDCGTLYDTLNINIFDPPLIDIPIPISLCNSTTIELININNLATYSYNWSPNNLFQDPTSPNQELLITETITIDVVVTDNWTGCTNSDSLVIEVDSVFVSFESNQQLICQSNNTEISFEVDPNAIFTFDPFGVVQSNTNNNIIVNTDENVMLIASAVSQNGFCVASDSILIITEEPFESFNFSDVLCLETSYYNSNINSWFNAQGDPIEEFITEPGIYTAESTNICGTVNHSIELEFEDCSCTIYVPNASTPNWDDINQFFGPVHTCEFESYSFQIFNRWGQKIFETHDSDEKWPGTYKKNMAQDGIYTWKIKYSTLHQAEAEIITGFVTVVR